MSIAVERTVSLARTNDKEPRVEYSNLKRKPRADRANTRCVSAHLPEEMYWQLKAISVEYRAEMQDVVAAAANALFERLKKPAIPVQGPPIFRPVKRPKEQPFAA